MSCSRRCGALSLGMVAESLRVLMPECKTPPRRPPPPPDVTPRGVGRVNEGVERISEGIDPIHAGIDAV